MLMNYHIGRLVLSSLCVGAFGAGGFWWCSFCRLKPANYYIGEVYLVKTFIALPQSCHTFEKKQVDIQ